MMNSAVFTCNRPTGESYSSTIDSKRAREPRITRGLAQGCRALVEAGRVNALRPAGVLDPSVVVELQQRPPLQHRDGGM
jgi:hypothetical protein